MGVETTVHLDGIDEIQGAPVSGHLPSRSGDASHAGPTRRTLESSRRILGDALGECPPEER